MLTSHYHKSYITMKVQRLIWFYFCSLNPYAYDIHIYSFANVCMERSLWQAALESPPVHDVGQPVHTGRVCGKQGGVENSWRRHHHEGKAKLQKGVTYLRVRRNMWCRPTGRKERKADTPIACTYGRKLLRRSSWRPACMVRTTVCASKFIPLF